MAATGARRTSFEILSFSISGKSASRRAIYPPVIDAVRVPPSAWITSQSIRIVFPPRSSRFTEALSERPMSRCIYFVLPLAPFRSRRTRVFVDRGSIENSAVIHPPVPSSAAIHFGVRCSSVAVHSTFVLPQCTRTDPSAFGAKCGSNLTLRNSSIFLPSILCIAQSLSFP